MQLGVTGRDLHEIEESHPGDNDRCKTEMLSIWLENATSPTWKDVADALHQMGEFSIALNMQSKYRSSSNETAAGMYVYCFYV